MLRLFVYGTLKRGLRNHAAFCSGFESAERACLPGRLYQTTPSYPMLWVPPELIVTGGCGDPEADRTLFEETERIFGASHLSRRANRGGEWSMIEGEVFTFPHSAERLRRLDGLENFNPGGRSLYHRVIAPVERADGSQVLAWVYVAVERPADSFIYRETNWRPR